MPDIAPAGYYHAEGDPEGTVRYWDGANWSGEPEPTRDHPDLRGLTLDTTSVSPALSDDNSRYGGLGIRIGASAIDFTIGSIIVLPFQASVLLAGLGLSLYWVVMVVMIAKFGGSPGKLAVGLRVTKIDGITTPPGDRESFMRTLPGLLGLIPVVGGLISLGIGLASIRYISTDPERRSIYDRMGGTRVVYKNRLS
jgi:uncharacterized RDD family membrane protein YckC